MSDAKVRFVYDGPAIHAGRVPAADIGRAITAMAELFPRAAKVLREEPWPCVVREGGIAYATGESADPPLRPSATEVLIEPLFERGSFSIQLILDPVALMLMALMVGGLFRRPRRELESQVGEHYGEPAAQLLADPAVRNNIAAIVRPLDGRRVHDLTIRHESESPRFLPVTIGHDDADLFTARTRIVDRTERPATVTVVRPNFREGGTWRVELEGHEVSAHMTDAAFMAAVRDRRVLFSGGDRLQVRLRTTFREQYGRIREEYEIWKVDRHIRGGSG